MEVTKFYMAAISPRIETLMMTFELLRGLAIHFASPRWKRGPEAACEVQSTFSFVVISGSRLSSGRRKTRGFGLLDTSMAWFGLFLRLPETY